MKALSRDFSLKEKILLLFLCLVLVGLAYYQFVDRPVRESLAAAQAEADSLTVELTAVQSKLELMRRMRDEVEDITAGGTASEMGSYNNSKEELAYLNDILQAADQYTISFSEVTRDGDQIRRNFALQVTAESYEAMETILSRLYGSHYRCLIGDIRCSAPERNVYGVLEGRISVNATATFFETLVGGVPDAGLPADQSAAA